MLFFLFFRSQLLFLRFGFKSKQLLSRCRRRQRRRRISPCEEIEIERHKHSRCVNKGKRSKNKSEWGTWQANSTIKKAHNLCIYVHGATNFLIRFSCKYFIDAPILGHFVDIPLYHCIQCCLHETTLLRITWNNTDSRVYDDANTDDASDADATDDDTLKMVLNCNARDLSDYSAKRHRSYQSSANRILIIVRYNHLKSPSFSFIDSNIRQSIVSVSVRSVRFDSHCIQTA